MACAAESRLARIGRCCARAIDSSAILACSGSWLRALTQAFKSEKKCQKRTRSMVFFVRATSFEAVKMQELVAIGRDSVFNRDRLRAPMARERTYPFIHHGIRRQVALHGCKRTELLMPGEPFAGARSSAPLGTH
jgi:hypothetical protein